MMNLDRLEKLCSSARGAFIHTPELISEVKSLRAKLEIAREALKNIQNVPPKIERESVFNLELKDITKEMLAPNYSVHRPEGQKIVIVKLEKNNFLTFIVTDCEKPKIPGYPAQGLTYFKSHKEAVQAIKNKYIEIGYIPKFAEFGFYSK